MPWLLNEDAALKKALQGLTVPDSGNATRPVAVRFRYPEAEVANEPATVNYPLIVIEHGGLNKSDEREHRGWVPLDYVPEGMPRTNVETHPYFTDFPIPYDIDYVVTTYARKALHDRALVAALAGPGRLSHRFGYLEVPQDQTIRSLYVVSGPNHADTMEDGRRLFRKQYIVRVSSELLYSQVTNYAQVTGIQVDLTFIIPNHSGASSGA